MREVKLKNKQLKKVLEDRAIEFNKSQELIKEAEKIDNELKKIGYKLNRIKDKTKMLVDKENLELEEYEEVVESMIEKGEVKVVIINQIEEYKKLLKEKKDE